MSSEKADLTDIFSFAMIRQQENTPRLGVLYACCAVCHGKGAISVTFRELECGHICQQDPSPTTSYSPCPLLFLSQKAF